MRSISGIGKFISRKLETKAKKHKEVYILAEAKLNTISNHISKAIEDGSISEPEFKLITDEVQKYRTMKEDIRNKTVKIPTTNAEHLSEKKKEIEDSLRKSEQLTKKYKTTDGLSH